MRSRHNGTVASGRAHTRGCEHGRSSRRRSAGATVRRARTSFSGRWGERKVPCWRPASRLADKADTTLYNGVSSPRDFGRLRIKPNSQITLAELAGVDWIVFASWVTEKGLEQLPLRKGGPKVALWAHHDIDQHAVRFLDQPLAARVISRYLFVSRWQRDRYVERFEFQPKRQRSSATLIASVRWPPANMRKKCSTIRG